MKKGKGPLDDSIRFDNVVQALVPDGEYRAVYCHHETNYTFKTPKVYAWFRIIDFGEQFETMVYRAYRVKAINGCRRNGGFTVRRGSDLYHDLVRVLDMKARPDRVSAKVLDGRVLRIKTRTVKTDYKQRPLPEWMRYSVVESIVGVDTMTP